jgi:hypothetical protein
MDKNTTDSQPDADGWITWGGGECPLEDGAPHQVRFMEGSVSPVERSPFDWDWSHTGYDSDIVAYRVINAQVRVNDAGVVIAYRVVEGGGA